MVASLLLPMPRVFILLAYTLPFVATIALAAATGASAAMLNLLFRIAVTETIDGRLIIVISPASKNWPKLRWRYKIGISVRCM